MANPMCFMDISIGGDVEGRVVMELYKDIAPKTVENFRALCTGEKGVSVHTGKPLHYKGTQFNHVVRGVLVQGGDISSGETECGESIYGLTFEDETFELTHGRKGIISMANAGPDTNGSEFFIVTTQAHNYDGKHVAFGKVVRGMGLVRSIEYVATENDYCPSVDVLVVNCGEIPEGADDGTINFFKDGDMYPDWPMDYKDKLDDLPWAIAAVESSKSLGNEWFKKQNYKMAMRKYRKSLRYLDLCWEMKDIDHDQGQYLRKVKSQNFNNIAACKLKLGDLKGALMDADFAIRDGRDNAKAFFRQGQVFMALNNTDAAIESFGKALELEPNNSSIKKEIALAKKKITDRHQLEKKAYSKMFD